MREVTCHEVRVERVAEALDDIEGRTFGYWRGLYYGAYSLTALREMRDELLDHVAARTLRDPAPDDNVRTVLRTAAECSLGLLSVGCYPRGDQELLFPLIDRELTSEDIEFQHLVKEAPTAATWIETFELCVVSGLVWEWRRVIGLLMRGDNARTIHDGVPYSDLDSVSDPADLAAMDALCGYLTPSAGHLPRDWPTVPLCGPDADERAEAARRLDEVGPLTPDQRLLRVLLDDDRHAFGQALAARLVEHREQVGADPAPRTLLPLGPLALAALAVQVHGWESEVSSAYLPHSLLGSTDALRRAADSETNTLGLWTAR
ncbi:immunity 49 family protein [Streptomyces sp. MB09-02B]|uniref:immunity 49 family protein n=1 Tax=Streptomyces sp. MB09-02B TaxID=3028667 RepID=UPI0029A1A331|nr:immunity 49 family protein [Streptomyces sp. MB09-02B]MDX3646302.1 immunity 49 family protein [Streptomyces sp. MB09-02B]